MKSQHQDLQNEFCQKHGGWNSKMTKVTAGNILLVCPPDMFDSLGQYLLAEKSKWKATRRAEDPSQEEFYAYEPYTPFSKYQTLKKQAGDQCVKVMTLEKGKARLTLANGLLPPGMNELEGSKYIWEGANIILNILWTSKKPAGAFSSLMSKMGGGSGSSSSSSSRGGSNTGASSDPFSQDELFKWIHRYVNIESCDCKLDRCTKDQCAHKKNSIRIESLSRGLLELVRSDKVYSSSKPCPCFRCPDKTTFTLRLYALKAEEMFAVLEKLALESVVLPQMINFQSETRLHEQQIGSAGNRLLSKWKGIKTAVSEQASAVTGTSEQEEEGIGDYVPKMPSKAGMIKSMFF